ncbi:MAG: N-acetylmuramoyl-L-alanine amidase [Alphaproteobacteria bacterium]|nr:MAG: N-acetylmuramoyl-L-alanine amidase [Alphaproteobacteria bacterium]
MTPVRLAPSPNHNERSTDTPDILLLHYTDTFDATEALAILRDPAAEVSAHYLVDSDGTIYALVPEQRRAWHAGRGSWGARGDINSRSIGIEVQNPGHRCGLAPFPDAQIEALIGLCRRIVQRWQIPATHVLGHSDIAPTRKRDPGELFPWARLAQAGIGVFPPDLPAPRLHLAEGMHGPVVFRMQTSLARYGYPVPMSGRFCAETRAVVTAFCRHFNPQRLDGIWDGLCAVKLDWLHHQRVCAVQI